ncbi:MAG: MamI family restriction endonuclease [Elusimicrobia bacterium]|nr:MamI family restriction endonuclease [Elusimicrobiota bacterium]
MKTLTEALTLLDIHYTGFFQVKHYAEKYGHPNPSDTRSWSQIIVSSITGIHGLERKKGADLDDGSDVKGANIWGAIDTPRFNGVIKAGTKDKNAGKLSSLDEMPFLFFVLWDHVEGQKDLHRCRIWVVRPQKDVIFRKMCSAWYKERKAGKIVSDNFQLHPPRGKNSNIFRNTYGNLDYPLLFEAHRIKSKFKTITYAPNVLKKGNCHLAKD